MSESENQFSLTRAAQYQYRRRTKTQIPAISWLLVFGALIAFTPRASAQTAVQAWVNLYNTTTISNQHTSDVARALAVDKAGNVFVTGSSLKMGSLIDYDWVTLGYSSAGVPLWTNRYNGPANSWDTPTAIAVDTNGNIFVTGGSAGGDGTFDYVTIAHSNAGVPLWTNRYNGPGNSDDVAKAVAADMNGDVFVTGYSAGSGSAFDYATIKYSSGGLALWTNRYNGPGNGADRANAMIVTTNGNVFVTGYSYSSGNGFDYATLAYSNSGTPLWTNRYKASANNDDRAVAIAAGRDDNVYVTGRSTNSSTGFDCLTLGYSAIGTPLWTNRYDGPVHGNDYASAIATDSTGNVFVTGTSLRGTSGSGDSYYDFATIAYSNTGVPLWTNRYIGLGADNGASAIAVDCNGNVFVTGDTSSSAPWDYSSYACTTIGYTGEGVLLWTHRYQGQGYDTAGVAVDGSGSVFVAGNRYYGGNAPDYLTIKYSVPQPVLGLSKVDNQLVLSWTNAGFSLQTAPASTGTFTNLPAATSPYTNPITAAQQFFRLKKN